MDDEERTRLETLVGALDEVVEFHERAGCAPAGLLEELRANRARLVRRLASPAPASAGDGRASLDGPAGRGLDGTSYEIWTCVSCERRTGDPDRDGWHVFSDGTHEQHSLCVECAAAPTRGGGRPIPLRVGPARSAVE